MISIGIDFNKMTGKKSSFLHVFQTLYSTVLSVLKTRNAGRSFRAGEKNLLSIYSKGLCCRFFLQSVSLMDYNSVPLPPCNANTVYKSINCYVYNSC